MCLEITCPKLQDCYSGIPYGILSSHRSIIYWIHVDMRGVYVCSKMMLYRKFLQMYIVIPESIIVKYLRWFLMIQLLLRCMFFDGQACAICTLCFKRNGHCDIMGVLIGYCHSKGSLIINP